MSLLLLGLLLIFAFQTVGCALSHPVTRVAIAPPSPKVVLTASSEDVRVSEPTVSLAEMPEVAHAPKSRGQVGTASFYGGSFNGRLTASGETFSETMLTAAHRTLDFGTRVLVTNLENRRRVVVTVNDRGPYARGRVIDLSRRAARALGFVEDGTARVRIQPL